MAVFNATGAQDAGTEETVNLDRYGIDHKEVAHVCLRVFRDGAQTMCGKDIPMMQFVWHARDFSAIEWSPTRRVSRCAGCFK